ncbi:MAG: penicillin binding protein PBP4B [Lachnospiraceae bacterium]|nr:penicillin binding protein PBP4B [Lachnospiraceae bacterium]
MKNVLSKPTVFALANLILLLSVSGCTTRNPWSLQPAQDEAAGELSEARETEAASGEPSEAGETEAVMRVVEDAVSEGLSADGIPEEIPEVFIPDDIPGPERISPEEAGIHDECIALIDRIIKNDVANGFPGAQLAVMRDGKLVYENAWGRINAYNPDGTINTDSPAATTDTLYDLASVTKVFGVNYALQRLVTEGRISLDDSVSDYLGERFYEDVIDIDYIKGEEADLETQKEWKKALTLRNLITHKGGFPADPHYCHRDYDAARQEYDEEAVNPLFAGNGADEETKEAVIAAMCRTPLLYAPGTGTLYSDVNFMILGVVVEQVTGKDLDTYLKETFCSPMGLRHLTYEPLKHGFGPSDCAATELNGNTREGAVYFDGIRTYTLQGEVHDENAYYCMAGVSGHAGLFGSASDLARLADVMLTGKHGDTEFFSEEVIEMFTAPESATNRQWGLGWWRQGNMRRTKYFGTKAGESTFGHQGWTGTLIMIDPEKKLVIAYLTNKINTPLVDSKKNANKFRGSTYTSASLGFVPDIIYTGLDQDVDAEALLKEEKWYE